MKIEGSAWCVASKEPQPQLQHHVRSLKMKLHVLHRKNTDAKTVPSLSSIPRSSYGPFVRRGRAFVGLTANALGPAATRTPRAGQPVRARGEGSGPAGPRGQGQRAQGQRPGPPGGPMWEPGQGFSFFRDLKFYD